MHRSCHPRLEANRTRRVSAFRTTAVAYFKHSIGCCWPFSACHHVELTGERLATRNQRAAVRAVKLRSAENDPKQPLG
jgi:hypothetical protein